MKNYNYKYELYDPYEYPNFSGYVITQDQLLRVKENRVEEQWDLDPIDGSINALIRSARSESDIPRNAQIFVDIADEINLDYVSDYGSIVEQYSDDADEEDDGWFDIAEHFAEL